ncbi:hypothetical protein KJ636_03335, partial [Patescibacteria group bacterium]|nr:hypothetical protein [Patescibacteria group bacterium]MBU4481781.1 hypothetical protein [Patescibacteria group bacterium]
MKLKKVILMVSLVAVFGLGFMFNTSTAQAQTTMVELQALIANLQVQIAQLQKQLVELQKAPAVWCYDFNITLKYGDTGEEVKALQTAFLKQGFLSDKEIAAESDYFGESMAAAVVDFQLKYKDEISKYAGYSIRASGVFGKGTRTKLNEIYGCGVVQPICTQRDESCCLGDRCSIAEILCPTGTTPVFKGCDVNCKPRKECQPSTPSITILSPNGGEQFNQGTALAIKWSLGGINPINIDLLDYGRKQEDGSTPFVLNIAHNNPSLKGALVWNIPSDWPTGNLYKIRISENTKAGAQDESDNYFSIVTCVRETTKAGVTCGGYFYEDYCENLSDGTGYANKRKCNASTGTDCSSLVNVDRTYCPYGCQNGVCKSVPSITVAVLSPNGGEQWQVGKTYSVTWKSSGLEQININLLSADPVNEGSYRVARLISNLSASIGNYSWAVPEKTECLSLP